jgi:hypothetical protein
MYNNSNPAEIIWAEDQSTATYRAISPVHPFLGLEHFTCFAGLQADKWASSAAEDGVIRGRTWVAYMARKDPKSKDTSLGLVHHFARLWKKPKPNMEWVWTNTNSNHFFWAIMEQADQTVQLVPVHRIVRVQAEPEGNKGYFEPLELGVCACVCVFVCV